MNSSSWYRPPRTFPTALPLVRARTGGGPGSPAETGAVGFPPSVFFKAGSWLSPDGQTEVLKGSEFDPGGLGSLAVASSPPQEGQKVDPSAIVWPQTVQNIASHYATRFESSLRLRGISRAHLPFGCTTRRLKSLAQGSFVVTFFSVMIVLYAGDDA